MFFALFGMLFLLTQYLQAVLGYSPLEAGVRVLPVALGLILASGLSARLLSGAGAKRMVAAGMLLVAAGLSVVTQADQESGYAVVAVALSLLGLGIGTAMAPATDSIMGSLPLAKASVGSAVNDTTRVAGGALGVAVIGSVVSSGYRGDMESVTGAPAAAQDSLAAALGIAQQVGGEAGARLADAAQSAFIGGMHTSALVAAGIALAGAALAAAWLPASAPEPHTAIPEAVPA
jgi:fucose permease